MRLTARLRSVYRKRRYWKWLIRDERRNPHHPSWPERWRAWRHGFLSQNYRWFGLDGPGRDTSEYLTDRLRYLGTTGTNAPYTSILDDKLLFHEVFRIHEGLLPETYALLRRGRVLPLSTSERVASLDDVLRLLAAKGRLIVKGTTGGGGAKVATLEERGEGAVAIGGQHRTRDEARAFLASRREHLVMEYVESAAYARAIFPGSSNTLRILTVWEEETGETFLPYALHRFGTRRSGGVDNFSRGGVCANIDVETGRLRAVVSAGPEGRPAYSPVHPETGVQVEGVVVPGWAGAARRILEIAGRHTYLPYVGWDLVITDSGIRVLEGNSFTGAELFQLDRPLLSHPRLRRFYERRGIIPPRRQ